jgi:hypothetical protein
MMMTEPAEFEFMDGGRKYTCHVEQATGGRSDAWWWFGVVGDKGRYAPFRAEDGDTEASVRARIVSYYEGHLERRGWRTQRPV